jgi:hypothetical protein
MAGEKPKAGKGAGVTAMTLVRASKIQKVTAQRTGTVAPDDFAARAMRAARKNVNAGKVRK